MQLTMSKYYAVILAIIFFIGASWFSGIAIGQLLDVPTIIFILIGTALLSLISYKKGIPTNILYTKIKRNCLITGFIGLIIGVLSALITTSPIEMLPQSIAVSLLMIPYSALVYWGIEVYSKYRNSGMTQETTTSTCYEDFFGRFDISDRERSIISSLMEGMSNKEIANKLYISENTVKKHVSNIFKKANVKNRHELICMIYGSTSE